ncbi:hypothetical protein F4703DRAFT_1923573 [Phycomyces blakesleeanus]
MALCWEGSFDFLPYQVEILIRKQTRLKRVSSDATEELNLVELLEVKHDRKVEKQAVYSSSLIIDRAESAINAGAAFIRAPEKLEKLPKAIDAGASFIWAHNNGCNT